ncbi:type II toxin-antitoxin system VapC family toxin [Butyrivibrio proteoclasticus]|uniref:type II toxin-antitoxin system VapC family toxin n=1 Tax=Butyrivibrio proteoclasticus TaxID=43305 RepID=UPI00047E1E19|nr:PIN domain-containing protein [Butyrivibrio proteoclasticus]
MKLLIDTNVVLDFLEKRAGGEAAKELFKLAENDAQYECVSSSSVTDILYVVTKAMICTNRQKETVEQLSKSEVEVLARESVERLLSILHILTVSEDSIKDAFALKWRDTEDALQYVVAKENNIDVIITNNRSDFEASDIPLMTAQEFLGTLKTI